MRRIRQFLVDEKGATAIEYGLIIAMISLVIVTGIGQFGSALEYLFGNNNSRLQKALGP